MEGQEVQLGPAAYSAELAKAYSEAMGLLTGGMGDSQERTL